MDKKGTITELWKTAGGTRWKVGLLLFMRAAIAFINVAVALLLRDLINAAVAQQKELFFSKAVFFIGLICGRVAAGAANRFLQERVSAELENKWKTRLFGALLRQDYGYVSAVHSGEWMTRLTNDTVVVAGGMTNLLPDLGGMLIRLVGAAAAILFMEPRFLYLLVPGTAALIGLSYLSRKQMKQLHKQVQEEDGALRTCLQESFSGMLVVRSYGVEPMALQQAETHMERHKAARLRRNRFSNLCNTGFSALMNTVYVAGACYCGYGILTGTISYGTFTAILQLIGQLQAPLANLSGVLPRYYAMVSSAERLLEAEAGADSEPQKKTVEEVLEVYENRLEKLVLEDISFSYRSQGCGTPGAVEQHNRNQVLSGWNFSIRKGDYVAMTGPSGCGKSTLLKLLMCLYQPDAGRRYLQLDHEQVPLDGTWQRLFAYEYNGYWKDVGTLGSYWEANMELIDIIPEFNLYEEFWKIYTKGDIIPPQYISEDAVTDRCLIGEGAEIYGEVHHSIIGPNVVIGRNCVIRDSIIMRNSVVGDGTVMDKAIVAEDVTIGQGVVLGCGEEAPNELKPAVYAFGIATVGEHSYIPDHVKIGKNTAISGITAPEDYPGGVLESGRVIKAKDGDKA